MLNFKLFPNFLNYFCPSFTDGRARHHNRSVLTEAQLKNLKQKWPMGRRDTRPSPKYYCKNLNAGFSRRFSIRELCPKSTYTGRYIISYVIIGHKFACISSLIPPPSHLYSDFRPDTHLMPFIVPV